MKTASTVYGRRSELSWLDAKLFPAKNLFNVPPLVLLYGPRGSGKSLLAKAVVDGHVDGSDKPPILVFAADAITGNSNISEFAQSLIQNADVTSNSLQTEMTALKGDFKIRLNELRKQHMAATEAYNLDGTARTLPSGETIVADDPEGLDLAAVLVTSIRESLDQWVINSPSDDSRLRMLFILDDFSDYAPPIKRWIGGPLLEVFSRQKHIRAPGFLLTDLDAWEGGGQIDYWQKNPGTFFSREIHPLEKGSCQQWLVDTGHAPTLIDFLLEETEGIPSRVRELLDAPGLLEEKSREFDKSKDFPFPVSARERCWLHAGAMAEFVSEESLLLLLGKREGLEALRWLESNTSYDSINLTLIGDVTHIHMQPDFRELVLKYAKSKVPSRHKDFKEKFNLQLRVTEKIPLQENRDSLRLLSPVQPFNAEMLRQVFGSDE